MKEEGFECAYRSAKDERKRIRNLNVEKSDGRNIRKKTFGLLRKLFLSKPYNESLVKKLSSRQLTVPQLKQINRAIKSGLSDRQLQTIINSKKDAGKMSVIIDIAINVNRREVKNNG